MPGLLFRIQNKTPSFVQGGAAGFNTGNRENLSSTQAGVAWVMLSFSLFQASNPVAPLCTTESRHEGNEDMLNMFQLLVYSKASLIKNGLELTSRKNPQLAGSSQYINSCFLFD